MKTISFFFLFMSFISVALAEQVGVGLMLGNPTGLNGKYWLNNDQAIDAGLGWSVGKHTDVSLHSDFLHHKKGAFFFNEVHPLDLYFGAGGRMEFGDDFELGIRVPVGLAHKFQDRPADLFAEIAPIFDFIGKTGVEFNFAVGARYYFK